MNLAPTLERSTVEIIRASLSAADAEIAAARRRLTDDERRFADDLERSDLRRRFIMTRALARMLVDRFASPDAVVAHTPRGKPYIVGSDVRFNVSHTGDDAVFAFVVGGEVGVDLERDREIDDYMAVARRFFAPRESYLLDGLPEDRRRAAFFRTWTRKEAVLKLTGDGIAHRMKTVAVTVDPSERPVVLEAPDDFGPRSSITIADLDSISAPLFAAVATDFVPGAVRVTHLVP